MNKLTIVNLKMTSYLFYGSISNGFNFTNNLYGKKIITPNIINLNCTISRNEICNGKISRKLIEYYYGGSLIKPYKSKLDFLKNKFGENIEFKWYILIEDSDPAIILEVIDFHKPKNNITNILLGITFLFIIQMHIKN